MRQSQRIDDLEGKHIKDWIALHGRIHDLEYSSYEWEDDVIERIEIMERTWKLANTHEIKQDEEIKTLQEDNTFLSNKINRNTQQDWELIMAILDYLELEREYYQSDFKLVKKEKGMR